MSWNMKGIKEAVWSMHFLCKFVTRSVYDSFFASCSALAIVFAKSQNLPSDRFWVAGRNAQVRWGEIWGGFVICRLRLAIWTLALDLTRRALSTTRAADRFNWRPSGEGTPPPFNLCSAYSFRSAKGSMQSEAGDCMRTKSWRLALHGIVPKLYWFAYMLGYRNMCCMSFRFWSTECGEHFCTKWGQMRCKKMEISLRSHAIKQTFAKMCPPLEQEQQFWKNVMQKVSWNMKSIKEAVWSLHFWCIFVSMSCYHNLFASCSALAIVCWKS